MDNLDRSLGIAAMAQLELDCPWCAEPVRATTAELDAGLTCASCRIRIELVDPSDSGAVPVPLAA